MDPRSKRLKTTDFIEGIGGVPLAVRRLSPHPAPPASAPVMVFLHEGLGSMDFWFDFPERLCAATGLDAVLYDRRGYGRSAPMTRPRGIDYLHREAYDCLPALLDRLQIPEAVLVGHSDGGTIALLFAGRRPGRVRCVVTEAAHVFVDAVTTAGIRAAVEAYRSGRLRSVLQKYHGDKTDAVFSAWADTWLSDWFAAWNIEADLAAVTAPVLVVQGEEDVYGTPGQVDAIAGGVSGPSEIVWVPGCGHAPHNDAPETVLTAAAGFIRKCTAPAGNR